MVLKDFRQCVGTHRGMKWRRQYLYSHATHRNQWSNVKILRFILISVMFGINFSKIMISIITNYNDLQGSAHQSHYFSWWIWMFLNYAIYTNYLFQLCTFRIYIYIYIYICATASQQYHFQLWNVNIVWRYRGPCYHIEWLHCNYVDCCTLWLLFHVA